MRSRDYIVPLGLLGLAAFVAVQIVNERQRQRHRPSAARPTDPVAVAPQGQPAETATVIARAVDAPAQVSASGEVTVQASREPAPVFDTARVAALLREGSPGTYLRQMLGQQGNMIMRWAERRYSMRVWIDRDPQLPDWDASFPLAAERAFAEWQEAGFPLRFDIVRDPVDVDISIRWIDRFPPADGARIGTARRKRDQHGWLVAAEVTVATHETTGERLSTETVHGTARHEIGHALGLGHSSSPDDVMFPQSSTPVISAADRSTLSLLYRLPPGRMP